MEIKNVKSVRIIYSRIRGKNELPLIRINDGHEEYVVNEEIRHPNWKSREFNARVRKLYQAARTIGLVESNQEVCTYLGMPYNHFEVWQTRANRRLPQRYGSKLLEWWNNVLVRKPPQIAGYLFSSIPPQTVSWNQTLQEAMNQAKKFDILCVVTDQNRLVGLLDYNTASRILEDLKGEHVLPKSAFNVSLKKLDDDRYLIYDFVTMRWDTENMKVLQVLKQENFVVVQDEKGEIEGVVPPFPKVLTYAPSPPFAEVYSAHRITQSTAKLHIQYIMQKFVGVPKHKVKAIDVGTGPGTFALNFAEYWMRKYPKGKIRVDAVERKGEEHFKKILERSKEEKKLGDVVFPYFNGVEDLTIYDKNYDLAIWHLVLPYKQAMETLPSILKDGGIVSICYYDGRTLSKVNKILTNALAKRMLCIPELKLLSLFRSEVFGVSKFVEKILPPQIERRFVCSRSKLTKFSDAESFLKFWFCASPLICGVLSTFDEYAILKERIWKVLLEEIRSRYGTGEIKEELFVNFIIGRK